MYSSPPPALTKLRPGFEDDDSPEPRTLRPKFDDGDVFDPVLQSYQRGGRGGVPNLPPPNMLARSRTLPTRRVGRERRYRLRGAEWMGANDRYGHAAMGPPAPLPFRRAATTATSSKHPKQYNNRYAPLSNAILFQELESSRNRMEFLEQNRGAMTTRLSELQEQVVMSQQELVKIKSRLGLELRQRSMQEDEIKSLTEEIEQDKRLAEGDGDDDAPPESERRDLEGTVAELHLQNSALSATVEAIGNALENQQSAVEAALVAEQGRREHVASVNHNMEVERLVLSEEVAALREQVDGARHAKLVEKEEEKTAARSSAATTDEKTNDPYLGDAEIASNLVRAQCEFYFSDYNLKRDKKLLEMLSSANSQSNVVGFLSIDDALNLNRVKQLCPSEKHLMEAMSRSQCLVMNENGLGRPGFSAPREKEFPFRRTVFVYGLPKDASERYLSSMLRPFGVVEKIEFDHGPDTLDRMIMTKMMNRADRPKVYKLLSKETAAFTLNFRIENSDNSSPSLFVCAWCGKKNQRCSEGFYEGKNWSQCVCLQCAASRAEEQLKLFEKGSNVMTDSDGGGRDQLRELLLGYPVRGHDESSTALCVFSSQRQASKCVYVRSRLAFDGSFATHFHHYSKMKKEIVLQLADDNTKGITFKRIGLSGSTSTPTLNSPRVRRVASADGNISNISNDRDREVKMDTVDHLDRDEKEVAPVFGRVTSAPDFGSDSIAHVTVGVHDTLADIQEAKSEPDDDDLVDVD